jgi:hypothetical protein
MDRGATPTDRLSGFLSVKIEKHPSESIPTGSQNCQLSITLAKSRLPLVKDGRPLPLVTTRPGKYRTI